MLNVYRYMFKIPDLRKKILFTLMIFAIYRFGAAVPVPGIELDRVDQLAQQADPVADGTATPLPTWQLPAQQPAAMTPLRNGPFLGMPAFDEQPAATPLLLTQPSSRIPEVFLNGHLQGAVLQRTGGAP